MNEITDAKTLNTPLSSLSRGPKTDLPLLPDREWLKAMIEKVEYGQGMFSGAPQFITDQDKNPVLDSQGQKIPRMVFNITFVLSGYTLNDKGDPRKAWLKLGASLNEKAHLTKTLKALGLYSENLTPLAIINALMGKKVLIQLGNKEGKDGKVWQNVIFDAIKKDEEKTAVSGEKEVEWDG